MSANSCKGVLAAMPNAADGNYWIDPDGGGPVAGFMATCNMSTDGGGWTRLTSAVTDSLVAGADYEYLYGNIGGSWYRSPKTKLVWTWNSGQELTGEYAWWNGGNSGSLTCNGSDEKPAFGVGCSNGGGGTEKVLPAYGANPSGGIASVCQDVPNAFNAGACVDVAVWIR